MIDDLIAGVAQQLGLTMELNDEGACRLVFEDKYTVDIQVEEDQKNRFYFLSTVGQAEAPTEAQLRTLLDANLFGQGTGEAALAYDPDMEEIALQHCFDARYVDLGQLMAALEEFVNIGRAGLSGWTSGGRTNPATRANRALLPRAIPPSSGSEGVGWRNLIRRIRLSLASSRRRAR